LPTGEGAEWADQIWKFKEDGNTTALTSIYDDNLFEFTKRVNLATRAFKLIQNVDRIREKFPHIRIELVGMRDFGEDERKACLRRKPFVMVEDVKREDGKTVERESKPLAYSKVMNLDTSRFPPGSHYATILKPKERGTGRTDQPKETMQRKVKDVHVLREYLDEVTAYLDNGEHFANLRRMVADPKLGGEFSYDLVAIRDYFNQIIDDEVIRRADAFNRTQLKAEASKGPAAKPVAA
jgi:hypothetical protein